VVGAGGEAGERPLVVVVVDEEQAHDLGGVAGVQRAHPLEHGRGGFPCVHGGGSGVGSRHGCRENIVIFFAKGEYSELNRHRLGKGWHAASVSVHQLINDLA
jgi:hypothetical protein